MPLQVAATLKKLNLGELTPQSTTLQETLLSTTAIVQRGMHSCLTENWSCLPPSGNLFCHRLVGEKIDDQLSFLSGVRLCLGVEMTCLLAEK